jgi:hypothetical protein
LAKSCPAFSNSAQLLKKQDGKFKSRSGNCEFPPGIFNFRPTFVKSQTTFEISGSTSPISGQLLPKRSRNCEFRNRFRKSRAGIVNFRATFSKAV